MTIANVLAGALMLFLGAYSYAAPSPSAMPDRVEVALTDRGLRTQVESYLAGLDGSYGVAAVNLDDGSSLSINANISFPTASMYKLLVMYRVFQQVHQGRLSLGDSLTVTDDDTVEEEPDNSPIVVGESITVADALDAMITISSNAAAYALVRTIGGWDEVASAATELGMNDTYTADGFMSSPADMLHFFELLANRSLVSPEASDRMISLLLQQQVNDRIPAQLPSGTYVAHKTGELDAVRNDGGIVYGPRGRFVLVMMSSGITDSDALQVEAAISRAVYDRFGS